MGGNELEISQNEGRREEDADKEIVKRGNKRSGPNEKRES